MNRKIDSFHSIFIILGLIAVFFIVLPPLKTIISSPVVTLWETILESEVYNSILLTIIAALMATFIGLLIGIPLAYLLARYQFFGKKILEALIDIPIVIPHSAAGVALLFVFGRKYFLGKFFHGLGIDFFQTFEGVVLAMMFISIPFLIDSTKEGFKLIDVRLERVARTLGASPWQVFSIISLPLAIKSIFSGSILMWARGVSEFGAIMIIAYNAPIFGKNSKVLPILISDRFNFGLAYARPIAALGILISLIIFVLFRWIISRGEKI
ncbi:MAG: ABC transporter permease [Atribacterota bacterium]|nr:ABC transporter permease [Atribacterota bacterium]